MDTLSFLVSVILIVLAIQFDQLWLVFGVAAIVIITSKSIPTIIGLVVAIIVLYIIRGPVLQEYLPIVIVGMLVFSLLLGLKKQPEEQTGLGGMDLFGQDMGGYGGLGGLR